MSIKGYGGSVKVGAATVGTAKVWSLDMSASETDSTTFADAGWSSTCTGLKSWSGSITVMWDAGADAGEDALIQAFVANTEVALTLLTEAATGTGTTESFTGNAVITSMPITNDVNSCIEVTFGFAGRGALTLAAII